MAKAKYEVRMKPEASDQNVENALYKSAVGYKYDEVTRTLKRNEETGKEELVVTKIVTKEVQPSITAQIFWLKNRQAEEWRDKQTVDMNITNREETVEKLGELFKCTPKSNGQI